MKRLLRRLTPLLFLLLLCCGCRLGGSIEELYSLPQTADEYRELQHAIDGVLASGAVYSAPVDGAPTRRRPSSRARARPSRASTTQTWTGTAGWRPWSAGAWAAA